MYEFYVGTTPKDPPGNIVKVCLDSDGQLVDKSYYEAVSPAYFMPKGKLYLCGYRKCGFWWSTGIRCK